MNPIQITVTGRLGDDPRTFHTRDGSDGVELRLAIEIPPRGGRTGRPGLDFHSLHWRVPERLR